MPWTKNTLLKTEGYLSTKIARLRAGIKVLAMISAFANPRLLRLQQAIIKPLIAIAIATVIVAVNAKSKILLNFLLVLLLIVLHHNLCK